VRLDGGERGAGLVAGVDQPDRARGAGPSANAAMPPPRTPNAWRTPSSASSRAISAEAVNAPASDQRALPPHPTTSPSGAEGAGGGSGVVTTG
jgi:hypothetical protein